jgi:hypothetical protein
LVFAEEADVEEDQGTADDAQKKSSSHRYAHGEQPDPDEEPEAEAPEKRGEAWAERGGPWGLHRRTTLQKRHSSLHTRRSEGLLAEIAAQPVISAD